MTSAEGFNCILCKETFDNKDELQIHFRKHGDPKFNESIKTKNRGQNEGSYMSEKSNDAAEMVNCDVCDEVFPTISKAITHKHKVHPDHDAKYFCPWCGKLFTMKHLYNKHLQTNHDADEGIQANDSHFRCDSCSVYFFLPAAMIYHNKFFHRQDTDLPIIGHSKKQKLCNQDLLPLYYCSFCGEEYVNKVNLHKHMCDDHGDENQRPSDVLRCPLCEAIFYHLDAYELHLTFHTSDDLYSETNEMNEKEMSEFSLETVPPMMERVEDLNNLPDAETDVNSMGIESFLQMAMDESHDGNQGKKSKSKKHKKHKKSKKSAITLDEFLNMNQDVFGEDLDFQGVEEVPTKVIKRQLKPKKTHTGAKFVSSADLQKLQKQGIVVKMRSGSKPSSLQGRHVGQMVKISPHVKNLSSQTTRKVISASDEVLSKLMNQSSNQIKIIKKPIQDRTSNNETVVNDTIMEDKNDTRIPSDIQSSSENIKTDVVITNNKSDQHTNTKSTSDTHFIDDSPRDENLSDKTQEHTSDTKLNDLEGEKTDNINSDQNTGHVTTVQGKSQTVNQNIPSEEMKDTLKNISKQITIKSVMPSANKMHIQNEDNKPPLPEVVKSDDVEDKIINTDMQGPLKNISKQITIKSVIPPTNVTQVQGKVEGSLSPEDENQDESHSVSKSSTETNPKKCAALDPLKNLNSGITIKAMTNKNITCENKSNAPTTNIKIKQELNFNHGNIVGKIPVQSPKVKKLDESVKQEINREKNTQMTSSSHMLTNLSKNITIKSMSPSVKATKEDSITKEHGDSDFEENEFEEPASNKNINQVDNTVAVMRHGDNPIHKLSSNIKIKANNQSAYLDVKVKEEKTDDNNFENNKDAKRTSIQSSNNLLKHLKNITAKPIQSAVNVHQEIRSHSNNQKINIAKGYNTITKSVRKTEVSKEIEIFNIDDSDDDDEALTAKSELNKVPSKNGDFGKYEIKSTAALNAIKNISRHITVKSSNYQTQEIKNNNSRVFSDDEMQDDALNDSWDDMEDEQESKLIKGKPQNTVTNPKSESFKNVFKNLGKHITVKSSNVSPSPSLKSLDHNSQDSNLYDGDSDADSCSGKVKIREITGDDASDNDMGHTTGIVTQSPDDSKSGDEFFTEEADEFEDYENQSKIPKTINHNLKSTSECLLKNISKNITVKSLNEKKSLTIPEKEKPIIQNKLTKELSIRNIKPNPEVQNESGSSGNQNINKQIEAGCSNQTMNLKVAKSPGVVNAVNKEVNVKTFQSETVIEEITTTVTKTIRRVNQVNQQVHNASQNAAPKVIQQQQKNGPRIVNYNQASNKFQGITVRHSSPRVQNPKIRQAAPVRPTMGTSVRPSNQIVPIRPNANIVRPSSSPRMQIKNMPPRQSFAGKSLKISPSAMNNSLKRPVAEEPSGPFSCFKKPKESLIPGNETIMGSSADYHFVSSSQTSKFSSTTKTVKDNSVMMSSQMKSESISQQQQINRQGNASGLKITKAKQVNVMESEISPAKRTTLEAIEKLKKQGLLIKKPRLEDNCEPQNSDGDYSEEFQDE